MPIAGAVTWQNQCHDRATLQGVIIPSAILKIVFSPYFILFLVFIARQYTDARHRYNKSVRPSIRLSIRLSARYVPISDENSLTYRHSFFTIW